MQNIAITFLTVTIGISMIIAFFVLMPPLGAKKIKEDEVKYNLTNTELAEISQILFDEDTTNFLKLVKINLQGYLNSSSNMNEDCAPLPLLTVNESIYDYLIIQKMRALYDNFEADSTKDEIFTAQEEKEQDSFIEALLATSVMKRTIRFLADKGVVTAENVNRPDYNLIREIWFDFYPRNKNTNSTSNGYEHVFHFEIKKGKLIGLHNWIYFHEIEKLGKVDYKGWMNTLHIGDKAKIVKIRTSFNGSIKPVTSLIVGISPELEMSLYTICFIFRPNKKCHLKFNQTKFSIQTHTFFHQGKKMIATAYVNI